MQANATQETVLQVQVRPQRIGVLLPWNATPEQALKAIHLLTVVWGGRYCPIIPCGTEEDQIDFTKQWLRDTCPDFICAVDVEHKFWRTVTNECCRPLRYYEVGDEPLHVLVRGFAPDPVTFDAVKKYILSSHPGLETSVFVHLDVEGKDVENVAIAATFGYLPEGYGQDTVTQLKGVALNAGPDKQISTYLNSLTRTRALTLLDAGSYSLGSNTVQGDDFVVPPTIVLFSNCGASLAHFWAVRMQYDSYGFRVLAFPSKSVGDADSVKMLAEAMKRIAERATFCRIRALPEIAERANQLARRLRPRLRTAGVKHVDVDIDSVFTSLPVVTGCQRASSVPSTKSASGYRFALPSPFPMEFLDSRESWMVDLIKDEETGRNVAESVLPSFRVTAHEALNAPNPPSARQSAIDPLRFHLDTVSVRANKKETIAQIHLPSAHELIGEHLHECGYKLVIDDKRPLYERAIETFGSLHEASQSCREPFRPLLLILKEGEILEDHLKRKAKLGKTKRVPADASEIRNWYKKTPIRGRLGEIRFQEHYNDFHPKPDKVLNVLDYWHKRKIVERVFCMPKCPFCRRQSWIQAIDLSSKINCTYCDRALSVGTSIKIGYRLNPTVSAAMDAGAIPVILTGQFLRNLTIRGFQWIPGFPIEGQDIDIVALCDGHLVMAECKDRQKAASKAKSWGEVQAQFERLIETARKCSVEAVFLASMSNRYPAKLRNLVKSASDRTMTVHLLTGADLETGYRKGKGNRRLKIHDYLPSNAVPKRRKRPGTREMKL